MNRNYLAWDAGIATGSEIVDGWLTVQVNTFGDGGSPGLLAQAPYGFLGRPLDPTPEGACQTLFARDGDEGHAIATVDMRVLPKMPEVKKGGSLQYGATGTFDLIDGENGSKLVYIPYAFDGNGKATKSMVLNFDVTEAGEETVHFLHGEGMGIVMMADGKKFCIKNASGKSGSILDEEGWAFFGVTRFTGGIAAGDGTPAPVAMATPLMIFLAAVQAALASLGHTIPPPSPTIVSRTVMG